MAEKHQITHRGGKGWLEAEWTEGAAKDTGIPGHDKLSRLEDRCGCGRTTPKSSRPRRSIGRHGRHENADATSRHGPWSGVRASIVALKPGNAGGAKGRRKMNA